MIRTITLQSVFAIAALGSAASAQQWATTDTLTDKLVSFSPVDGSLLSTDVIAVNNLIQVGAIGVGVEIWVTEQLGDRVVRYDHGGNVLGVIGPTFPGGGFDNIRGLSLLNGLVYVCNDGAGNSATADSLVVLDTAGNHVQTLSLSNTSSPFGVTLHQGDLLVTSSGTDDVHRYTLAGASVGTFHNSASISFASQVTPASDGNVWVAGWSSDNVQKLDATTGNIIFSFTGNEARGVAELQNGNILWSGGDGVFVYDVGLMTSTQVFSGNCYQLNSIATDVSFHKPYGTGCHDYVQDRSNLMELFPDFPAAKAALDGNALHFTLTSDGYVAQWLPGGAAAYVVPTGAATVIADVSTNEETFTPSAPVPVPGGVTATWTVSTEGILTAGDNGNETSDSFPSLSDPASEAGLAFYTWFTQNPTEAGSGKIKWEEAGTTLYVTFDGVEAASGSPTTAPSTYQWQIDMTTGNVMMLWSSMTISTSTSDVLVGCTLAGTGLTAVSQTLSAVTPVVLQPDKGLRVDMTAAPPPVINPGTVSNYTITNLPETAPGSGAYLSLIFFSLTPFPAGFDLAGLVTTVPGCNLYLGSLDLSFGLAVTATPTSVVPVNFSTPTFAPGDVVAAQAVALFDPAFPLLNGESGGFLLSNGILTTTWLQ